MCSRRAEFRLLNVRLAIVHCDSNHLSNDVIELVAERVFVCEIKIKIQNNNNMCNTGKKNESNNKAACWSNSECNHREIKSNINVVEDTHSFAVSRSRRTSEQHFFMSPVWYVCFAQSEVFGFSLSAVIVVVLVCCDGYFFFSLSLSLYVSCYLHNSTVY